jgi:hypothetical protein
MLDQGLAEIHRIDLEKRIEIEEEKQKYIILSPGGKYYSTGFTVMAGQEKMVK